MKDAQGGPVRGRIRWRRFAAVVIPAAAAAGAIVFGMANGAIAAQFTVSGQPFKVSADALDGQQFIQYGGQVTAKNHDGSTRTAYVASSVIGNATLTNLCQSVKPDGVPVSVIIRAGQDPKHPVTASNLAIDMTDLKGDATFGDINIGQDAGDLTRSPALNGMFGQSAATVHIEHLKQVALGTHAGTFTLNGLHLYLSLGDNAEQCF
ncbi:cholesterol esterase [Planosporangium thailandense]|uniref:Cholesterol esterase n=1 Tax=Planosporangium thailandense TaxID=765197 RepID=A0ABX0Y5H8_9ACTN|nr:cholesterol esterase [Planosporangium thailandense]